MRTSLFLVPFVIALSAGAQSVVQVSGGGNALDAAAQTAAPGTTFVVAPGDYLTPTFVAQDATVIGADGVRFLGGFSLAFGLGSFTMRNCDIVNTSRSTPYGSYSDPGSFFGRDADVVLDEVRCSGVQIDGGTLVAAGCTFPGDLVGARFNNATVALTDCRVSGGLFFSYYGPFSEPQIGMAIFNSTVRLERTDVDGFGALYSSYGGASAISLGGTNVVTIVGGTLTGGPSTSGTTFASAISGPQTGSDVRLFDVQTFGAVSVPATVAPLASAEWLTRDLTLGGTSSAVIHGLLNGVTAVVLAFDIAPTTTPLVAEPLFVLGTPAWIVLAGGAADVNGDFPLSLTIPNQPALQYRQLWLTGLSGTSFPLASTAPLGGIIE